MKFGEILTNVFAHKKFLFFHNMPFLMHCFLWNLLNRSFSWFPELWDCLNIPGSRKIIYLCCISRTNGHVWTLLWTWIMSNCWVSCWMIFFHLYIYIHNLVTKTHCSHVRIRQCHLWNFSLISKHLIKYLFFTGWIL